MTNRGLLPGAPVPTGTGLTPAGLIQLPGRNIGSQGRRGRAAALFPIPLSIRACGFPAHGLPTVFWSGLRRLRVTDGAHQLMQALVVEPVARRPLVRLTGTKVAATLLDQQTFQPPRDVPVDLEELLDALPVRK